MRNPSARTRLRFACSTAAVALLSLPAPAGAWEVINNGLPTFAAAESFSAGSGAALDQTAGLKFETVKGWNPGYSYRFGGKYLFGMERTTDGNMLARASGFGFSQSSVKFGYDMGAFKPFVSASFAETRAPAFGANVFAAPPDAATPFAFTSSATSIGAGFDYAITDKLSFGMSINAAQVTGWRR